MNCVSIINTQVELRDVEVFTAAKLNEMSLLQWKSLSACCKAARVLSVWE